jgi:hypothetical protein
MSGDRFTIWSKSMPDTAQHLAEQVQSFDASQRYNQLTLQDAPIIQPTANDIAIAEFERLINEIKSLITSAPETNDNN